MRGISDLTDPVETPAIRTAEMVRDFAIVTVAWIAVCALLRPFQNTPFQDDWIYAWRVTWLLDHGQWRTLENTSNPNIVQVFWGALFCLPYGFSFTALRVSTAVTAVWTMWGQYLLLREFEVSRRDAWIGTALLGLNPIFFMLAFTFMTEVPFLCLMIWSCYGFVRAVRRKSTPWLFVSIAIACLATGVRVVGIVLPLAASCALFFNGGDWGKRRLRFLYPVIAPLVLAGFMLLIYGPRIPRTRGLGNHLAVLWEVFPPGVGYAAMCLGVWLLPLAVGLVRRRDLRLTAVHFVWLMPLVGWTLWQTSLQKHSWPLFGQSFWKLTELGHTGGLPDNPPIPDSYALAGAATILAVVSLSALIAVIWKRRGQPGEAFLAWQIAIQIVLAAFVWLIFDRYLLSLAPLGIALALSGKSLQRPALVTGLVGVLAIAALVGTRDHLAYNGALWQGINELRQIAPDNQINAGYVPAHWLMYTHPETAPKRSEELDLLRYQIYTSPLPGARVLKTIPYKRWFGSSGTFYVMERN